MAHKRKDYTNKIKARVLGGQGVINLGQQVKTIWCIKFSLSSSARWRPKDPEQGYGSDFCFVAQCGLTQNRKNKKEL